MLGRILGRVFSRGYRGGFTFCLFFGGSALEVLEGR